MASWPSRRLSHPPPQAPGASKLAAPPRRDHHPLQAGGRAPPGPDHGSHHEHRLPRPGLRKDLHRRGDPVHRGFAGGAGLHDRRRHDGHQPSQRIQRRQAASCSCRERVHASSTDSPRPRCQPRSRSSRSSGPANQIVGLPYIYGGGHASFISPGYDCSGTVSFALHGASLLSTPEDSSEFECFGSHGAGRWVDDLRQPRSRLHDGRRTAPGHELGRRPFEPAGSALASAAPRKRRVRRSPPPRALARAVGYACGRRPVADRSPSGNAIGGSDGRLGRAHVYRREGEGLQAAGSG